MGLKKKGEFSSEFNRKFSPFSAAAVGGDVLPLWP